MGTDEIAKLAGVSGASVSNWKRRYSSFPKPVATLAVSEIYLLDDIIEWLEIRHKVRRDG